MRSSLGNFESSPRGPFLRALALLGASLLGSASPALAQFRFSIDHRGPTNTLLDSLTATCITPGDILGPPMPLGVPAFAPPVLPPPAKMTPAGLFPFPGLAIPTAAGCICLPPPAMCPLELDALSYGMDFNPAGVMPLAGRWVFSVDEFAVGIPGALLTPNVTSEGAGGLAIEAASDVFEALGVVGGPLPPPAGAGTGNTAVLDGNGFVSPTGARQPGVGLIEPIPPLAGPAAPGDNIDAIDFDTPPGTFPVYFSLDAAFFDPLRGIPNVGAGPANLVPGAAVLMTPGPGIPPVIYVPPFLLGLDVVAGPGTDDLDALSLTENGIPGYQMGLGGDVLYYSVRRGSAVIGFPDSLFGIPIEAGDILTVPIFPGGLPSIYIAAEWLGLVTTRTFGAVFGDDLDGLDCRAIPATGVPFCIADGLPFSVVCPCGNNGVAPNGCANSVNPAGANLAATGGATLAFDTVTLTSSGLPAAPLCIVVQSPTRIAAVAFGDGMRCFGGPFIRMYTANAAGGVLIEPMAGTISGRSAAAGAPIPPFAIRYYQTYYRNPPLFACPLPATFNVTNAVAIQWFP